MNLLTLQWVTNIWWFSAKTLNKKTGNCALILYKTNGQRVVLNAYYAPFPLSTETLIYFDLTVNLVGGVNVVCFVSLLINIAIHTTLWASQTSADHEQGAWSATGARSLVKRCAHFIAPLLGNGIAYFLSTRNNPYFSRANLILQTDPLNLKKATTIILKSFLINKNYVSFDFNDETSCSESVFQLPLAPF